MSRRWSRRYLAALVRDIHRLSTLYQVLKQSCWERRGKLETGLEYEISFHDRYTAIIWFHSTAISYRCHLGVSSAIGSALVFGAATITGVEKGAILPLSGPAAGKLLIFLSLRTVPSTEEIIDALNSKAPVVVEFMIQKVSLIYQQIPIDGLSWLSWRWIIATATTKWA